jgi:energy-coupling factor transporter transmembrane protein EcfT
MTEGSSIQASGQITAGDLYRFSLYVFTRRLWWVLLTVAAAFIYFVTSFWSRWAQWEWNAPNIAGPLFVFVLMPWGFVVSPYFAAKKQLRTNPHLSGTVAYTFSDQGLATRGPHTQAQTDWNGIVKVRETSKLFLIFPQNAVALVVPKRFFASTTDESQARSILRSHVKDTKLRGAA